MKNYSRHIRKRERRNGKSAYQVVLEVGGDENGKRIRRYKTADTKAKANDLALQMIEDLNLEEKENGSVTGKGIVHVTVEEWAMKWLDTFCTEDSETTKARYRDMIEKDIAPKIGAIRLDKLTCMDVQEYLNEIHAASPRTGKPLSAKTVKNLYHILNSMMKKAVKNGSIAKNPCDGVTLPKRTVPKTEIYDQEMIQKCLQCAKDTDLYLPLVLSFSLGLRRGELLGLKWDAVDLEKGTVYVRDNRVVAGGKVLEKNPKSEAGVRDLFVGEALLEILRKEKEKGKSEYVVSKAGGAPYSPDSFSRKFKRFLRKNGLPDIKLHATRHSCASLMLSNGVDISTVQKTLGHASPATTLGVYAHSTVAGSKAAAEKVDQLLLGPKVP